MSDDVFRLFNEGVTASLNAHDARQQGDFDGANEFEAQSIEAFEQVLAIDPQHAGAIGGKGMAFSQLGRTEEALAMFQQAIKLDPDFAEYHRQLGSCHAEMGDFDAAREAVLQALDLEDRPEYRQHAAVELYRFGARLMRLASAYRDDGYWDEEKVCYRRARGMFNLVLDIQPNNSLAVQALALIEECLDEFVDDSDTG